MFTFFLTNVSIVNKNTIVHLTTGDFMDSRNKKLVLIGIRRKGENRFKIRTVAEKKSNYSGMLTSRKANEIGLTR